MEKLTSDKWSYFCSNLCVIKDITLSKFKIYTDKTFCSHQNWQIHTTKYYFYFFPQDEGSSSASQEAEAKELSESTEKSQEERETSESNEEEEESGRVPTVVEFQEHWWFFLSLD